MKVNKINIGGIECTIKEIDYVETEMGGNFGKYNTITSEIVILKQLTDEQKQSTLIHEILETINHIYDIKLKHHQICLLEVALFSNGLMKTKDFSIK